MLGLFGTLSLGARSLQTQQQGVEVAGHNIANVNNPAYARQRLAIQTTVPLPSAQGPQGTGAESLSITQLRSSVIDFQIQAEGSVRGYLESYERALQYAQSSLGQQIDTSSSSGVNGVGTQHSIADSLSELFTSFQNLSLQPTSQADRQILVLKASEMANQFNSIDQRLGELQSGVNQIIEGEVGQANRLLGEIAKLNDDIALTEATSGGVSNDLRDLRQNKIESLSKLVKVDVGSTAQGQLTLSIAGNLLVSGKNVVDTLQTFDAGSGQMLVRTAGTAVPLALTGGSIAGNVDVRDTEIANLRNSMDTLAARLISEVNAVHVNGYSLTGTTGALFFTGSGAADMSVNSSLVGNPALIQAAGTAGNPGDNSAALQLAQLASKVHPGLGNQSFAQHYGQTVALLGQSLSSINGQLEDQTIVESMLNRQRDALSGVSIDEEMADMVKFQRAYQASAKFIATVDEMLEVVMSIKR